MNRELIAKYPFDLCVAQFIRVELKVDDGGKTILYFGGERNDESCSNGKNDHINIPKHNMYKTMPIEIDVYQDIVVNINFQTPFGDRRSNCTYAVDLADFPDKECKAGFLTSSLQVISGYVSVGGFYIPTNQPTPLPSVTPTASPSLIPSTSPTAAPTIRDVTIGKTVNLCPHTSLILQYYADPGKIVVEAVRNGVWGVGGDCSGAHWAGSVPFSDTIFEQLPPPTHASDYSTISFSITGDIASVHNPYVWPADQDNHVDFLSSKSSGQPISVSVNGVFYGRTSQDAILASVGPMTGVVVHSNYILVSSIVLLFVAVLLLALGIRFWRERADKRFMYKYMPLK